MSRPSPVVLDKVSKDYYPLGARAGGLVEAQPQSQSVADAVRPLVENRTIAGAVMLVMATLGFAVNFWAWALLSPWRRG